MSTLAHGLLLMLLVGPGRAATAQDEPPGPIPEEAPVTDESPVTPPPPTVEAKPPSAASVVETPPPRSRASDDIEPTWYDDLALNAFVSAAAVHNFAVGSPLVAANATRLFDRDNDTLKLDVAELVFQDEANAAGSVGFKLDLVHGLSIPVALGGNDIALQQAFITYLAPVGDGLRLDVGTFMSHIGAESIENFENFNDLYSRGFLFSLGLPPLLTGLRLRYPVGSVFNAELLAVNGWRPNVIDTNNGKTLGLQLTWAPNVDVGLHASYVAGPEKPDDNGDWRHLVDVVASLRAAPVTLVLEALYGHEPAPSKSWFGALATLRWDIAGPWALGLRGEYFDDSDGFALLNARLWEISIAPSLKIADSAVLRAEVRHDHALAQAPIFRGTSAYTDSQTTAALNLLFVF